MKQMINEFTKRLHQIGRAADTRALEIENKRSLPPDIAEVLLESGVIRLWVAERYGGAQASVESLLDAVETLAYYNGSLAWVAMVTGTAALNSGFLSEEVGHIIFDDPMGMTGGLAAPMGTAVPVAGGLRVNGRWLWGSGTPFCSWIVGVAAVVDKEGKPSQLADGTRMPLVYFPKDQVELIDTWRVSGLKGTASGEYEVKDLFVPDGYWTSFPPTQPQIDAPLYRFPFLGALAAGVASVGLGLANRALDEIKQLGPNKAPRWSVKKLAERPSIQAQVAEAEARYMAAGAFLRQSVQELWSQAEAGPVDVNGRRQLRMAASYATTEAAKVVDAAYHIGGGSSIWESVPLQRLFRDVHVVTQHGIISPQTMEMVGKMGFGLPVPEGMV
ncbi:MAG: acyl-CoA dehydrogenase family protein [Chloroflexota bacterium]